MPYLIDRYFFTPVDNPWQVGEYQLVETAIDLLAGLEQGIFANAEDVRDYVSLIEELTQPEPLFIPNLLQGGE